MVEGRSSRISIIDHDELIADLHDDLKTLSTPQRLAKARARRKDQIRRYKEIYANEDLAARSKAKIRFSDNVVLLEAAARNDVDEVRELLTQGIDPNQGDDDGLTALHQSCIDDFQDLVRVLVEFGADVNARDTENWTPLHAAATCGHTNICRILLENGADILAVNADQSISFDICEERSECLFYLQNEMRRAGITQKDIDKARKSQEVNLIEHCKELSQTGNDLDEPYDQEGATILHYAAAHGYLDLTRFLLSRGVQVNNQDKEGWTPLHAATCWMQPEIIKLLSKVPDINPFIRTKLDERPLDLAEFAECHQLLEELEKQKKSLAADVSKGSRPINRQSVRGSIRRSKVYKEQPDEMKKIDVKNEKVKTQDALLNGLTENVDSANGTKTNQKPKESDGCCTIS